MTTGPSERTRGSGPTLTESSTHELRTAVMRLSRRIKQNSADDRATEGQMAVLIYLYRAGATTPGELSTFQRVTAPSMNRTINTLQDAGYAERVPSNDDRRNVLVTITAAGRELVAETLSRRDAWLDIVLARLEPDERDMLEAALPILRKLSDP